MRQTTHVVGDVCFVCVRRIWKNLIKIFSEYIFGTNTRILTTLCRFALRIPKSEHKIF